MSVSRVSLSVSRYHDHIESENRPLFIPDVIRSRENFRAIREDGTALGQTAFSSNISLKVPHLSDFVQGFEFEMEGSKHWEVCKASATPVNFVEAARMNGEIIGRVTLLELQRIIDRGQIRHKTQHSEHTYEEYSIKSAPTFPLKNLNLKTNLTVEIQETECSECKSLILFTTEPHCAICEARQLRNEYKQ